MGNGECDEVLGVIYVLFEMYVEDDILLIKLLELWFFIMVII